MNSTSSISGNSFSRNTVNKVTIATHRQKITGIRAMISNVLNMIDHQPMSKNNSCSSPLQKQVLINSVFQSFFSDENLEREIKNRKELKGFSAPVEIEHADLETIKNFRIVDRTDGQTAELFRMIDGSHLHPTE